MAESPREDKASSLKKNPDAWTTGDEPMTSAQASSLKTLYEEAGKAHDLEPGLSKAEAFKPINQTRRRTRRGTSASSS